MIDRVRLWLGDELRCPDIHGQAVEEIDIDDIPDEWLTVCLRMEETAADRVAPVLVPVGWHG